ncbi:TRAP transporter small permease [Chloroflexota bacterium]
MKLLARVTRIFDGLVDYLAATAGALILCAMLIVTLEVIMRYFLHRPQIWAVEFSEYILVWFTFLGATWILREGGHARLDMAVNQLSPRAQVLLGIISSIIGAVVCLLLIVYGTQVTLDLFLRGVTEVKSQILMPKAPLVMIIPIGSLPLAIQFVRRGYRYLEQWRALPSKTERR